MKFVRPTLAGEPELPFERGAPRLDESVAFLDESVTGLDDEMVDEFDDCPEGEQEAPQSSRFTVTFGALLRTCIHPYIG